MAEQKIASSIPAQFFLNRSKIALEDGSNVQSFRTVNYEPPMYDPSQNYYSIFWNHYLTNEKTLNDI